MHKTSRFLRQVSLILLAGLFFCRDAKAAGAIIGAACPSIGVSQMSDDQKNLIVCLKNDGGALVWKSMTSSSDQLKITNYNASDSSNQTRNLGAHKFCALATEGESGGCGRCSVYLSQGNCILDKASCSGSSYTWCEVSCFD